MGPVLSTTLIALAIVVCATVAVCVGSITADQWLGTIGAAGGGGGVLHLVTASTGKSAGG